MSRRLDEFTTARPNRTGGERHLARSTASAFAAAISTLLISTLVVSRSGAALEGPGTATPRVGSSGTVALTDDDEGRSLFDLRDIGPGQTYERCVQVTYEGSLLPVDLTVTADAGGDLAHYLETTLESGSGGGFDSCDDFIGDAEVFGGSLGEFAELDSITVGRIYNSGDTRSFRVRFELEDTHDALGLETIAGLVWDVRPS